MHIKEHMWTIGTCPTTILLSAMSECVNECYIERSNDRGTASYEMANLYAPQGVDLGGMAPLKKSGMTQYENKWLEQENGKL